MYWLVLPFCLTRAASALPPLVVAADIAQPDLNAYYRPSELWVGVASGDNRPGICPLNDLEPRTLPVHLDQYTTLGDTCQTPPTHRTEFGGNRVVVTVAGDALHPIIRLSQNNRPIAESLLGRPATVCSVHLIEADATPGPELVVVWDIDNVRGVTVYRVPESLDGAEPAPG
ncbi:MAG: hypothetical protein VX944_09730 [Myxococcota bacterium]|nr:hypothetical protein [Myxococcota bacterium]